uniref:RING-type domain-containing protein n=1 Tax=Acrobeloides nanus TaxID=290746 RepID=A0A914DDQ2_9BILA
MECIHRWIDQAKTCPTCRKRTQTKDIIKLFFDAPDVDLMSQTSTPEEQIARLGNALDAAKAEHAQTLKELQTLMKRILELESRLKTEKKKSESLGMYQEKNRHLEHMLQDQQQLKDRLK